MVWIKENIATLIIVAILALIIGLIVAYLIRKKKRGESTCGCGCSTCPMGGACSSKNKSSHK